MELQDPASLYRAPFPFVPVITPGKTYYRLSSATEQDQGIAMFEHITVATALGSTQAEHVFLKGQPEEAGAGQAQHCALGQQWTVEQAVEDVSHGEGGRAGSWKSGPYGVPAAARIANEGVNHSLPFHGRDRLQSENQVNSVMRQEHKFPRWVAVTSSNRMPDRSEEVRNEGQFLKSCLLHRRRRSDDPNHCHIPDTWMLPSEVERSWNKSPRPIADLIYNYERSPALKMSMPESRTSVRLSMSSRFPVSEMAERYMQSNRTKE